MKHRQEPRRMFSDLSSTYSFFETVLPFSTAARHSSVEMVRADLVASAREKESCNDGRDVYDLDQREQGVTPNYAIDQKQDAGNQPD